MRILVAPTAFKGSLGALEAARAMAKGVRAAGAKPELMPISDGGDGLIEALLFALGGRKVRVLATGPLGEKRRADFALIGRTAVVEMARASGLALVPKGKLDALGATSYGTGQLIRAALDRGARKILVGLGGSAANDGGAGCAQALGAGLLDERGRELGLGGGELLKLDRIDASGLDPRLKKTEIILVSDVRNPLLGPRGSARVYGPQKGASPAQVELLERALARWAKVIKRDLKKDVARVPGAGAAGALGSGLLAFSNARLAPGSELVLSMVGARARLRSCEAVLTGEGSFDRQSLYGKAPAELARLARACGRPAYLACGRVEPGLERALRSLGVWAAIEAGEGLPLERAMREAAPLLSDAAQALAALASAAAEEAA